jgi:hypothetical protein
MRPPLDRPRSAAEVVPGVPQVPHGDCCTGAPAWFNTNDRSRHAGHQRPRAEAGYGKRRADMTAPRTTLLGWITALKTKLARVKPTGTAAEEPRAKRAAEKKLAGDASWQRAIVQAVVERLGFDTPYYLWRDADTYSFSWLREKLMKLDGLTRAEAERAIQAAAAQGFVTFETRPISGPDSSAAIFCVLTDAGRQAVRGSYVGPTGWMAR